MTMSRLLKSAMAAVVLGSAVFAGCSSTQSESKNGASASAPTEAVMCAKCETVWIRTENPNMKAKGISSQAYSSTKKMTCPDCQSAAENFFKTGKFEHTCKACGDSMKHCTHK